jgi:hypothetical protein
VSDFPSLLRAWMGDRTRADVAPILGVTWSTVHNWMLGQSTPPATRLPYLAGIMGIPAEQLAAAWMLGQPTTTRWGRLSYLAGIMGIPAEQLAAAIAGPTSPVADATTSVQAGDDCGGGSIACTDNTIPGDA